MGAPDAGARATLTFSGTGASFIAYQDEWSGIANIYVDGTKKAQVDTYSSPFKSQSTLYSVSGLAPGTHTLAVEAAGTKNASSSGTWIWVDAFNVISDGSSGAITSTGGSTGTATVAARVQRLVAVRARRPVAARVQRPVAARVQRPVAVRARRPVAARVQRPVAADRLRRRLEARRGAQEQATRCLFDI